MIKKSVAGVAAGVLLIGGGALATAQAEPGTSESPVADRPTTSRLATSQQVAAADDQDGYGGDVTFSTSTRLSLHKGLIQYGATNNALVVVRGVGTADRPTGDVRVVAGGKARTATLRSGQTVVSLPRLALGRYSAAATYTPNTDDFTASTSESQSFRVVKSGSTARGNARRISRGERPVVHARVSTNTGVLARGKAVVRIANGKVRRAKTVTLRGGQADVRFPKVFRKGRWTVTVTYKGSAVVRRDVASSTFRVTR